MMPSRCRVHSALFLGLVGLGVLGTFLPVQGGVAWLKDLDTVVVGDQCRRDEHCGDSLECDSDSETCRCSGFWNETTSICYSDRNCKAAKESQFYDQGAGRCKCLANRICGRAREQLEPDDCIVNSSPSPNPLDNICFCNAGYAPLNSGRFCLPEREPGQQCEAQYAVFLNQSWAGNQCSNGTICVDGVCKCDPSAQVWSESDGECVIKVGGGCNPSGDYRYDLKCTQNTVCEAQPVHDRSTRTGTGLGLCVCPPDYTVTEIGECVGGYGAKCDSTKNCMPGRGFRCLDGHCACGELISHIYDPGTEKCMALIGTQCDPKGPVRCVETATCDPETQTCACGSNYESGPSANGRRCYKAYGQNCTANGCDFTKGLTCVAETGSCKCADSSLEYELEYGACLAPVGGRCGKIPVLGSCEGALTLALARAGQDSCEFYVADCVSGAECKSSTCALHGNGKAKA